MEHKHTTEDVLEQAMQMADSGVAREKIFAQFPDAHKDLKGLFDTMDIMQTQINSIHGSEENLKMILNKLDAPSFIGIKSPWINKYSMWFSATVTLALILMIGTFSHRTPTSAPTTATDATTPEATNSVMSMKMAPAGMSTFSAPTGNIDDAITQINSSSVADAPAYNSDARDANLVAFDKNDISEFNTN